MNHIERVRCPNCGSHGERHHLTDQNLLRTQCPQCDYFMLTCSVSGKVIEAYAPGLSINTLVYRVQPMGVHSR
jgi:DNA-directed RNA polymerase subunit RPC12/RpoP